jgi:hypothetical protein
MPLPLLTCILPLAMGLDADVSVRVQVAPGVTVNLHSDSYYQRREEERRQQREQLQAQRDQELRRQEALDREKPREPGSMYLWRDTPEQRERERQHLREEHQRREEERLARERLLREEEERDRQEHEILAQRRRDEENRHRAIHDERNNSDVRTRSISE